MNQDPHSISTLLSLDEDELVTSTTVCSLQKVFCDTLNQLEEKKSLVPPNAACSKTDVEKNFSRTKKHRKSSSISPSLNSLEDAYDRIEKFLDNEGLFLVCPPSSGVKERQTTLKACPRLERYASFSTKSKSSMDDTNDDILSDIDTTTTALPSFLAKRASLQRAGSFKLTVMQNNSCGSYIESAKVQKSNFAKFTFFEATSAETVQEPLNS